MKTVVVGMSGGVDSSVAALLLKEQGFRVIGLFMKNWEEKDDQGVCTADRDFEDVAQVASCLNIPYYQVNFSKEYWELVFARCLEDFKRGHTPNPDILCNQEIKFKAFFYKALELGADYVATGHYCQKLENQGRFYLAKGTDCDKDQSYFLYTMRADVLERVLFPLGGFTKKQVRALAERAHLATSNKKDSTGICFIGKRDFPEFLSQFITPQEGHFETAEGKIVGRHRGAAFYTIGQRRGLAIGGAGEAWFVVGKVMERNAVIVAQGEAPLFTHTLEAWQEHWIYAEPSLPLHCRAKIRYRSPDMPCIVTRSGDKLTVVFETAQRAITPGQSIVFYQDNICLGGALISRPLLQI